MQFFKLKIQDGKPVKDESFELALTHLQGLLSQEKNVELTVQVGNIGLSVEGLVRPFDRMCRGRQDGRQRRHGHDGG